MAVFYSIRTSVTRCIKTDAIGENLNFFQKTESKFLDMVKVTSLEHHALLFVYN